MEAMISNPCISPTKYFKKKMFLIRKHVFTHSLELLNVKTLSENSKLITFDQSKS